MVLLFPFLSFRFVFRFSPGKGTQIDKIVDLPVAATAEQLKVFSQNHGAVYAAHHCHRLVFRAYCNLKRI